MTVADKDRTIISILEKVFSNEIINIKVFASISPICHYTNFDALHNIISNKEFYLSPISSMTDISEFDWSINIIDRCVSGGLDSNLNGVIKSALELATEAKEETYVSCWSSNDPDDLQMWLSYGNNGAGVSLQCDVSFIAQPNQYENQIAILAVNYFDEKSAKIYIKDKIQKVISELDHRNFNSEEKIEIFENLFVHLCVMNKQKYFSFENEKRVVCVYPNDQLEAFLQPVPIRGGLLNVLKIPLKIDRSIDKSTTSNQQEANIDLANILKKIVIGPSPDQRQKQLAVQRLLEIHGYSGVEVELSKIPYRGR